MHALFAAFAPIWALTALGYLAGRTGLLGEQAEAVLTRFVFNLANPAALFGIVSRTPLRSFANTTMLAFAVGTVLAGLIGFAAARWLFGRKLADQAIGGMAAGYVNAGNLGIPVAVQVLGDASFVAPILLFQTLLLTPLILATLDSGTGNSAGRTLTRVLKLPLRNPIILGSGLGCLVSATGVHLPATFTHSAQLLGGAGVPTALITLGLSLHGRPATTGSTLRTELGLTVLVKNLIQPLLALAVGAGLLHLPAHQLLAVVVCSALPTAQNCFTYAREYGVSTALARDSVVITTLVSMATLSTITWAFG